jgi:hypothetical protein
MVPDTFSITSFEALKIQKFKHVMGPPYRLPQRRRGLEARPRVLLFKHSNIQTFQHSNM